MKMSKYLKVNLDIGHFVSADFDPVAYIREHHADITNLHLKDRKKHQGDNMPWGQGDTPISEVLQLLKKEQWPIPADIEYEYQGTGTSPAGSEEVLGVREAGARVKRIGMGLVGPGFVGAHHIDAVRRLGFVDVVAIAASSAASARRKADALGVPQAYGSFEDLVADPDVHVVHNTTPNYLHVPVILAALAHGKHVISDKPLATTAADARLLLDAAHQGRRRPRGDVQLPRQPAGAAGARDDRRRRARRRPLHPRRLSAGLAARGDRFLVAARAGEGRRELRGRRHRLALVRSRAARHRPAHRRGARRSDDRGRHAAEAVGVDRGVRAQRRRRARSGPRPQRGSRDDPAALRRRRQGQRVGRPGLRRPQERPVVRGQRPAGVAALGAGAAERAVDRPPRRRQLACSPRIRRCSRPARAPTRTCPAATRKAGPTRSAT